MGVFGVLLIGCGIAASLATLVHDVKRLRVESVAPQAAPKRLPPEIHAVGGIIACALHVALAYGLLPRVADAIADRFPLDSTARPRE
jgi:hypothetical protein